MTTVWTLRCAFCGREFTAPASRDHCSLVCRHRHRWVGTVPDAHRHYLVRRADHEAGRRTSTTPTEETNR